MPLAGSWTEVRLSQPPTRLHAGRVHCGGGMDLCGRRRPRKSKRRGCAERWRASGRPDGRKERHQHRHGPPSDACGGEARDSYLGILRAPASPSPGSTATATHCTPTPPSAPSMLKDIRRSIQLAQRLGQHRVVTMSGLPGGSPAASGPIGLSMRGIQRPSMYSTTNGRSRRTSGARPTGSPAITTSKSPSSYIRRTSSSTARPSTSWWSSLAPPTSASI